MYVIHPPLLDFSFMRQRPQQLMIQAARHGHCVFYCNLTQIPGRPPERVLPNLTVIHDHADFVRNIVTGLEGVIVWCSWARLFDSVDIYRPDLVVFDALDDFPLWRSHEDTALARADMVICSSQALLDRLQGRHQMITMVPNGCDYPLFSQQPEGEPPAELRACCGPRAVFTGTWGAWVDSDLVEKAAKALPYLEFLIIGPLLGGRPVKGPNVHHLGPRPYEMLPAYLHRSNVALLPFADTDVTRAANPIKMWEYLAVGLPVVSTPLPEVMPLKGVVHVAEPGRFVDAVESALSDHEGREARQALARASSWEARYQMLSQFIPELGPQA